MKPLGVALSFGAASVIIGAVLVIAPEFLLTPPEVVRDNGGGSDLWAVPPGAGVLGLAVFCAGMLLLGPVLRRLSEFAESKDKDLSPGAVQPA